MRGLVERRIDVGGVSVNACVEGEGPPLVLVHGLGGSWRYWYRTVEAVRERCRVVAVDIPGFGRSDPVTEPFSLSAAGDTLLAAWETLGLERPALVGHSMGGALVTDLAARHPGRVGGLGLVAAAGFDRLRARRAAFMLPVGDAALRRLPRWEHLAVTRPRARRILFRYVVADPRAMSAYDALLLLRGAARATQFASATAAILAADVTGEARRVDVPALVVWGDRDAVVPVRHAQRVAEVLPHARVRVLPGVGHMPMLEAADEVAAELERLAAGDADGAAGRAPRPA